MLIPKPTRNKSNYKNMDCFLGEGNKSVTTGALD